MFVFTDMYLFISHYGSENVFLPRFREILKRIKYAIYYTSNVICNKFKSSTTLFCVIHFERDAYENMHLCIHLMTLC